jgi:hypothetical protein
VRIPCASAHTRAPPPPPTAPPAAGSLAACIQPARCALRACARARCGYAALPQRARALAHRCDSLRTEIKADVEAPLGVRSETRGKDKKGSRSSKSKSSKSSSKEKKSGKSSKSKSSRAR